MNAIAIRRLTLPAALLAACGCGTTKMSDTARTATEQLLISNAIDQAVSRMDFRVLANKQVYFDPQYLEGAVDKGYLISSIRQHLLASGCVLVDERTKATYVVEARTGGVGTDRHSMLIGIPEMTVPTVVPGQPSYIPELPFAKKTDQHGVAKIAVFAYNRLSGTPVWQSGVVQTASNAKDVWLLGAGPFQHGSIRESTTFAGEPLPSIPLPTFGEPNKPEELHKPPVIAVTQAAYWPELPRPRADPKQLDEVIRATNLGNPLAATNVIRAHLSQNGAAPPPPPSPPPDVAPPPVRPQPQILTPPPEPKPEPPPKKGLLPWLFQKRS